MRYVCLPVKRSSRVKPRSVLSVHNQITLAFSLQRNEKLIDRNNTRKRSSRARSIFKSSLLFARLVCPCLARRVRVRGREWAGVRRAESSFTCRVARSRCSIFELRGRAGRGGGVGSLLACRCCTCDAIKQLYYCEYS